MLNLLFGIALAAGVAALNEASVRMPLEELGALSTPASLALLRYGLLNVPLALLAFVVTRRLGQRGAAWSLSQLILLLAPSLCWFAYKSSWLVSPPNLASVWAWQAAALLAVAHGALAIPAGVLFAAFLLRRQGQSAA